MTEYVIDNFGVGKDKLIDGNLELGFFGEVTIDELIDGENLANMIGLEEGIAQYTNHHWLKFVRNGIILFVAQKCYRYDLTWDAIQECNAVDGSRILNIGGYKYKIRLFRGAAENPTNWDNNRSDAYYDAISTHKSEWNDLMYHVHQEVPPSQTHDNFIYTMEQSLLNRIRDSMPLLTFFEYFGEGVSIVEWTDFDIQEIKSYLTENTNEEFDKMLAEYWQPYRDSDLNVSNWYGRNTWCQEAWAYSKEEDNFKLQRGCESVAYATVRRSFDSNDSYGWRPILELIP